MENPFEQMTMQLNRIERIVENLQMSASSRNDSKFSDTIGGIELAVEVTGLARPTIYVLTSKNEIPHFKKNKKLYFSKEELLNWIKGGRCKTKFEIAQDAELQQIRSAKIRKKKCG